MSGQIDTPCKCGCAHQNLNFVVEKQLLHNCFISAKREMQLSTMLPSKIEFAVVDQNFTEH